MTYPTREQIDELLRLAEKPHGGNYGPPDPNQVKAASLAMMLAVPMARLLKAAGEGLADRKYRDLYCVGCNRHVGDVGGCKPDCWVAALVEIGGER